MIVGLFTELASIGGVQRVGRHLASVLANYAKRHNLECAVLSLNDPAGAGELQVGEANVPFRGFGRSKLRFTAAGVRTARQKARIILAGHPNLAPVAALLRAAGRHSRSIVVTHGIEVWSPMSPLRRWALRRADRILAPSAKTLRQVARAQGVQEKRIELLPWGLDPEFEQNSSLLPGQPPPGFPIGKVILTVARLDASERYKGVDHLIQSMPLLAARFPDVCLAVVGDGDDRPRLEALALSSGGAGQVHFLGALERSALLGSYRHCDLFAMPSRGEGFGVVFLEAMAFGKPVVGGAHGGTPDIIEEGRSGFLVTYGDTQLLAETLARLLADDTLRQEMGRRAEERVREEYLFVHFQQRFERILDRLCAS